MSTQQSSSPPDPTEGVFGISVAASMVGTGVQNLRAYERAGLLEPSRTLGGTRLYSQNDVARLRHIDGLLRAGLNLAGIAMVLALEADVERLRVEAERLRARLTRRVRSSSPRESAPSSPKPPPSAQSG